MKRLFKKITCFVPLPALRYLKQHTRRSICVDHFMKLLVVGLLSGLLLFPSPSSASFNFGEVYYDGIGLENVYAVAISPEGSHIYAAGSTDDAMAVLTRDSSTGQLSFVQSLRNGIDNVNGLRQVQSIIVSPDGKHVYAASSVNSSVAVFERNNATGALTFKAIVKNGVNGVAGLGGARSLALSSEGAYLYVAGNSDKAIAVFSRDSTTGGLTFIEVYKNYPDPDYGIDCLEGVYAIATSPDGKHLYATGETNSSVAVFSRDSGTGRLSFKQGLDNNRLGVTYFENLRGIDLSPDGAHVYVVANRGHSIAAFSRVTDPVAPNFGQLTFVERWSPGAGGLNRPEGVMVSPDGAHVFSMGNSGDGVSVFRRDPGSGHLSLKEDIRGVEGLSRPSLAVQSPDGKHLYISCLGSSDAIVIFSRETDSGVAAYGDITFVEAFKDSDAGIDGITNVKAAAVSPGGNHVYTLGYTSELGEKALATFSRDTATGRLTFMPPITGASLLDGASSVTVSQDGNKVYAAGYKTLVVYSRNGITGELIYENKFVDNLGGIDGLENITSVVVSPNDKHVYVTSRGGDWENGDNAIALFERDSVTGLLTFIEKIKDAEVIFHALDGANSIAVSPDGKHAYTAANNDDAVGVFSRNSATGRLTFLQVIKNSDPGMEGLWGVSSVVVSPDNRHVYATGKSDDAIVIFNRDTDTGLLTFSSLIKNSDIVADCLDGPHSARITPDGSRLYVAVSDSGGGVTAFTRDPITGDLAFEKVMTASDDGIPSLNQPQFGALSPDNGHLYTAPSYADTFAVFDLDYDQDGTPNNLDDDDDGDNALDVDDLFPADPTEWDDTDGDGTGNNADTDDDNDGALDTDDAFPLDPLEWEDFDGDRTGNNADTDDDNDGVLDNDDAFQFDPSEWKDTDGDGTGDNADTDDDNDGVDDDVEAAAPGNGDGNADGTRDILQDNVTSLTAHESTQYITLATVSGTTLADCQATGIAAVSDEAPENADFTYGLVNFSINGLTPGAATTATIYLPEGTEPKTYYKYGRTPDNPENHWYEFLYDGTTGAEINGNVITLHFVDGKRGDDDLTENGVVVDPGGPSFNAEETKSTGGGGCFINSLAP